MKKLKIGFIGAGYIAQVCHLPFFYKNKNCEITVIVEKNKSLLNKVANQFKVKNKFVNYKDIITKKLNLDAVVICVNKFLSAKLSSFFIQNKISVFSEKPIGISLDSVKKLNYLTKKYKTSLVAGFMKRHDYGSKIVKNTIQKGELGIIEKIQYDSFMGNSFPKNYKFFKYKKPFIKVDLNRLLNDKIKDKQMYVNFLNNHSHGINLIRFYLGDKNKLDFYKIDLRNGFIYLKLKKIKIHFNYSFSKKGKWNERIKIFFKNATITQIFPAPQLKNKSSKVIVSHANEEKSKRFFKNLWSFQTQADSYIENLLKKKRNICHIGNCLDDMKLIEKFFV